MILLGVKTCSFFFFCLFNKSLVTTSNRNQFCITNFLSISRMRFPIKSFLSKHRYPVTIVTENRLWKQKQLLFNRTSGPPHWLHKIWYNVYWLIFIDTFKSTSTYHLWTCEGRWGEWLLEPCFCCWSSFPPETTNSKYFPPESKQLKNISLPFPFYSIRIIFLLSRQQLQMFPLTQLWLALMLSRCFCCTLRNTT